MMGTGKLLNVVVPVYGLADVMPPLVVIEPNGAFAAMGTAIDIPAAVFPEKRSASVPIGQLIATVVVFVPAVVVTVHAAPDDGVTVHGHAVHVTSPALAVTPPVPKSVFVITSCVVMFTP